MKTEKSYYFTISRPFNIFLSVILISIIMAFLDWYFWLSNLNYSEVILASLTSLYAIIGFTIGSTLSIVLSLIIPFFKKEIFFSKKVFSLNYFYSKIILSLLIVFLIGESVYVFTYPKNNSIFYFPQKELIRGKKNVILITIDTLRQDSLKCYGYSRETSPFIDSIADKGILFENCVSQSPWTLPSHASIFTSKYPSEHGAYNSEKGVSSSGWAELKANPLPDSAHTMAEFFSENGYLTSAFIGGDFLNSSFNINQGFDYYNENLPPFISPFFDKLVFLKFFLRIGIIKNDNATRIMNSVLIPLSNRIYGESFVIPVRRDIPIGKRADEINPVLFKWLNDYSEFSFFLFINYFDPHDPYDAPGEYKNFFPNTYTGDVDGYTNRITMENFNKEDISNLRDLYDGEIRFTDSQIEKLFNKLELLGIKNETLVIITSDHGEAFGEHGFRGHARTLYNELINVPLIIYAPWITEKPVRIKEDVELVDILPTVTEITGIKHNGTFSGKSLLPFIKGTLSENNKDYSVSQFFKNDFLKRWDYRYGITCASAKINNFKFIDNLDGDPELYDLITDPGEINNIADSKPELIDNYRKILSGIPSIKIEPDEISYNEVKKDIKERLKALGYIR